MRAQRPVRGGRRKLSPCVLKSIDGWVKHTARKFGVSRSFVVAVALAEFFGVSEQETFLDARPGARRNRKVSK